MTDTEVHEVIKTEAPTGQPAELVLVEEGVRYKLMKELTTIGRHTDCDIVLSDDDKVSRKHAEIKLTESGYVLSDSSFNGSRVNGEKVKRVLLQDGDELRIGRKYLTFYDRERAERTRLRKKGSLKAGENPDLLRELYREVAGDGQG